MKKKGYALLAAALLGVAVFSGSTAAYLLASPAAARNIITVGSVKAELTEDSWNPENGRNVYPNQEILKDPVVVNTGKNEAFVFLEVGIPTENIALADDGTGKKTDRKEQELFTFQADTVQWQLIAKEAVPGQINYVYGYKKCLKPGEKTVPLFESVKAVNYLEGELDEEKDYPIPVTAKVIQTNVGTSEQKGIYGEFLKQYKTDQKEGGEG